MICTHVRALIWSQIQILKRKCSDLIMAVKSCYGWKVKKLNKTNVNSYSGGKSGFKQNWGLFLIMILIFLELLISKCSYLSTILGQGKNYFKMSLRQMETFLGRNHLFPMMYQLFGYQDSNWLHRQCKLSLSICVQEIGP